MENTQKIDLSSLSIEELDAYVKTRQQEEAKNRREAKAAYEALREETIERLHSLAWIVNAALVQFKDEAFSDMQAMQELLMSHSKRHADGKGNFRIDSEDGTKRIEFSRQENGKFDERSKEAEGHIADFVTRQFAEQPQAKKLITSLLERRKGHLDIKLIQRLYAMEDDFQDISWKEGIRLLKESWQPTGTKTYITFHYRDENSKWNQIPLNFSSL